MEAIVITTVAQVFFSNLDLLLARLPLVRDGDTLAIHDARVATRRLRAALSVLTDQRNTEPWQDVTTTIQTAGRELGRSRDTDVALDLLGDIERRSPATAAATATMRAHLLSEQVRRRRRLIKRLEALDLESLRRLHEEPREARDARRGHGRWRQTRHGAALSQLVSTQADDVRQAVEHATGVYFPNRAHGVRVAVKKLRYSSEMIPDAGGGPPVGRRALRAAQEALGQVHDRELLWRRLKAMSAEEEIPSAGTLARVLEAECRAIFETYRGVRAEVLATCDALTAWAHAAAGGHGRRRALAVGAMALPPAALLVFASRARRAS